MCLERVWFSVWGLQHSRPSERALSRIVGFHSILGKVQEEFNHLHLEQRGQQRNNVQNRWPPAECGFPLLVSRSLGLAVFTLSLVKNTTCFLSFFFFKLPLIIEVVYLLFQ